MRSLSRAGEMREQDKRNGFEERASQTDMLAMQWSLQPAAGRKVLLTSLSEARSIRHACRREERGEGERERGGLIRSCAHVHAFMDAGGGALSEPDHLESNRAQHSIVEVNPALVIADSWPT